MAPRLRQLAAKKEKLVLSPQARNYVASWPAGETREFPNLKAIRWLTGRGWSRLVTLRRLVDSGHLTAGELPRKGNEPTAVELTRTAKVLKPYKPRAKQQYNGPFPWPVQEHWKRMCEAPPRVQHAVLEKLTGDEPRRFQPKREVWFARFRVPTVIKTVSELTSYRKALLWAFGIDEPTPVRPARHGLYLPAQFPQLMTTGAQVQLLLLDMLLEPVVVNGKCTGFRAIDPGVAEAEIVRLAGGTEPLEKYLNHCSRTGT